MEKLKSGFEFIFASYKRTAAILFIAALTLAIPITITLVGQQQDIRQRAETSTQSDSLISGCGSLGDVNGDGKINSVDQLLIQQYSAGLIPISGLIAANSDVSRDGRINSADQLLIQQYVAGLISTFPACPTTTDTIPPTSTITSPSAGSTQTSTFTVTVTDSDTGGSGLSKCYYAVFDQAGSGPGIPLTERTCNASIVIQVGPTSYGCQKEGPYCNVRIHAVDKAGNSGSPDGRNFSISYTGTGGPPTVTPTTILPCRIPASLGVGTGYYGDVNGDGKITQTDSNKILEFDADDNGEPSRAQIEAADVNGRPNRSSEEDDITSADAKLILQYVAGLISTFPACPTTTPTTTGIPPGTTNLSGSITLPGIGASQNPALGINNNPKRPQRNVEVTIVNSGNQQVDLTKSTVNYDSATGKYKGSVNLGSNFVSGSYLIKVRLDNTLRKTIPGIQNITSGQTYNAPEAALVSGDIIQDNEINLLDYNALLSCIGTQACATKVQADMNDDGKVEELDLNILYAGFAKRVGD